MIILKKIFLLFFISIILVTLCNNTKVTAADYYARSYVVMDSNGKVLESKDKDLVRSVASISKIMTAIVAIENTPLDKYIKVSNDVLKAYGSSIYLKVDEVVTMEDLLYGLMLRSGNDAAVTIANGVSGSIKDFVILMNDKAQEIGMKNSIFNNPSGLDIDDEGNLSTSYDMALLMNYAMNNETFRKITSTKEYKSNSHGTWLNKNKLLRQYSYTNGGKTGFTTKAKRTLVTSAKKDDTELVIVTLDCGGDFAMHKQLYEKYFNNYKTFKLLKEGSNLFEDYELICSNNFNVTLNKEDIKNSKIIYSLSNDTADIILITNDKKEILGSCASKKIEIKIKKKNWWRTILNK